MTGSFHPFAEVKQRKSCPKSTVVPFPRPKADQGTPSRFEASSRKRQTNLNQPSPEKTDALAEPSVGHGPLAMQKFH